EIHNDLRGPGIIARDGASKSPWRSFRASEFAERMGQDVVEGLDHRAAELLGHPDALRHPRINVRNLDRAYLDSSCRCRRPGHPAGPYQTSPSGARLPLGTGPI